MQFPLSQYLGHRITSRKSRPLALSIKAVLDSVPVDDIGPDVRNPSISWSYRNPDLPKPNQIVLDAQARVCTGPTRTRPLSEEQAFKVLETILKSAWLLDLGKFSLGIGIGLQCFVAPLYIGQIAPKNIRGACTFANELMATFAMSLMYFIGNLIAWQILAIIGVVPCVLQVLGVFFIPESPRWLSFVGQQKRSVSALQQLRGVNANVSQEADQIRESMEASRHHSKLKFLEFFDRKEIYSRIDACSWLNNTCAIWRSLCNRILCKLNI